MVELSKQKVNKENNKGTLGNLKLRVRTVNEETAFLNKNTILDVVDKSNLKKAILLF